MNPGHAVDVFVDLTKSEATVVRRRDDFWWHGPADARALGSAVAEGLNPKRLHEIFWQSGYKYSGPTWEGLQIVVVFHRNHQTIVITPHCTWGKAPDIILGESPRFRDLGEAILQQARHSAAAARESE
jgi:hypothetical protein